MEFVLTVSKYVILLSLMAATCLWGHVGFLCTVLLSRGRAKTSSVSTTIRRVGGKTVPSHSAQMQATQAPRYVWWRRRENTLEIIFVEVIHHATGWPNKKTQIEAKAHFVPHYTVLKLTTENCRRLQKEHNEFIHWYGVEVEKYIRRRLSERDKRKENGPFV